METTPNQSLTVQQLARNLAEFALDRRDLKELQKNRDPALDPAVVVGPVFARVCGSPDNAVAILVGTQMFTLTLGAVKAYIHSIHIQEIKFN